MDGNSKPVAFSAAGRRRALLRVARAPEAL
jgi:hypothetical protein